MDWAKVNTRRLKKIMIGLVIFFAVYTLFGFVIFPYILKSVLTKKISEILHREVAITQIKMNPYTLSTTVRGFQVKDRKGLETFVSFDELFVNLQSLSVFKWALIFKEIRLTNPLIRIGRHPDMSYNFSDLIEKEKEPLPAEKGKPLKVSLNNIQVINGSIDFEDEPKQTKHTVKALNITVPFISNIPYYIQVFVQPSISATINETHYSLQGQTKPFADSLETTFDVNIDQFDIPYYLAYVPFKMNFKIPSGTIDAKVKVSFIQYKDKKNPSLKIAGNVDVKQLALDDGKNQPLLRLPLLATSITSAEPFTKSFHLSRIFIQSPEVNIQRDPKGDLNIARIIPKTEEPEKKSKKEEKSEPFAIDIDEIKLEKGKIAFVDFSRKKPFRTKLDPLELKIDRFSTRRDKKSAYLLLFKTDSKESFKLDGNFSTDPLWAEGTVEAKAIPLKKYVPYYQEKIRFDVEEGRLELASGYQYTKGEKESEVLLSKISAALHSLKLKRPDDKEAFFTVQALSISETEIDLTQKKLTVGKLMTEKGTLSLTRLKNGEFDLQKLLPPPGPEASKAKDKATAEKEWVITLNQGSVDQYTLRMEDLTLSQPARLVGERIAVRLENISTVKNVKGKVSFSFLLDKKATLSTQGAMSVEPLGFNGSLQAKGISIKQYSPYYRDHILFDIEDGSLDFFTQCQFNRREKEMELKFLGLSSSLTTLRLKRREGGEEFLNLPGLSIKNTSLDLTQQEISVGDLSSEKGSIFVRRFKDGKLNIQTLFPSPSPKEVKPLQKGVKQEEKPWIVKVGRLSLDSYRIKGEDMTAAQPVILTMDEIRFRGDNLSTVKGQRGNVSLSFRLQSGGALSVTGPIGIDPLFANLNMNLKEIDIKPFQPYFTDKVKITVTNGLLSTAGMLSLSDRKEKGVGVTFQGGSSLSRFSSIDKLKAEDFLKWQSLSLEEMKVGYNPTFLHIQGVALTDFYARLIIRPDGFNNLQSIFEKDEEKKTAPVPKPQPKETPPGKDRETPRDIKIERVTLQGGHVQFSDFFIKPNYSANLVDLAGRISGLSSEETKFADVDLRGKLDQYAPLEITGKINPLREDLFVDLRVKFKDIDLSPFTPYSGKYVGYTVQKGKLSLELKYLVQKMKLDSQNKIFFDQLTLGEKVESPDATSLPVKLAISLLRDRKGEIDLDVPVTGSLDDPEFSVFRIILKIIGNLLVKAATSPFALIGAILGGGEQLDYLEFDYGRTDIMGENLKKVNLLAKSLQDRPSIKLEIQGHVDKERDSEALQQYLYHKALKVQKLNEMIDKGMAAIPVDQVKIEPQEYEKYLKMAYKAETFPKPRNFLGFAKSLPAPEMEKLMLTYIVITDWDLRALASQRAMKVKDAIVKSGQIEPERIFIIEPKSLTPEEKEKLKESRVEFRLN